MGRAGRSGQHIRQHAPPHAHSQMIPPGGKQHQEQRHRTDEDDDVADERERPRQQLLDDHQNNTDHRNYQKEAEPTPVSDAGKQAADVEEKSEDNDPLEDAPQVAGRLHAGRVPIDTIASLDVVGVDLYVTAVLCIFDTTGASTGTPAGTALGHVALHILHKAHRFFFLLGF